MPRVSIAMVTGQRLHINSRLIMARDRAHIIFSLSSVQSNVRPGHAKPTVPQNIRGTSTLSDYNPAHTLIFTIILYKSCAAATFTHLEPLLLKNYVCIVAFASNTQRALI